MIFKSNIKDEKAKFMYKLSKIIYTFNNFKIFKIIKYLIKSKFFIILSMSIKIIFKSSKRNIINYIQQIFCLD